MNAIVLTRYGTPDDLELRDVDTPRPKADEVLIAVHASAVNDWDLGLLNGTPLFMRVFLGLLRPKTRIMGAEVAGRVEAVGDAVRDFRAGDDVYGDLSESGFGGFAEFVSAPEHSVRRKPTNLTYEQAVAIPHAAMLAHQALYDIAQMHEGQTLIINGAGGGVGTIGLQLATRHGIEVTGVDSTAKQGFLRSLGFDHVMDYTEKDFTRTGLSYDLILDAKTTRSPFAYARALRPNGTYVTVGGSMPRVFQCLVCGWWIARTRRKHIRILALKPNRGLDDMTELVEAGKVVPSIDETYPLRDVPQALRRFEAAHHKGKIVIAVR